MNTLDKIVGRAAQIISRAADHRKKHGIKPDEPVTLERLYESGMLKKTQPKPAAAAPKIERPARPFGVPHFPFGTPKKPDDTGDAG